MTREQTGRQHRSRTAGQKEQQQFPQTGPYHTSGTVLHEFQEPVSKSHKFQFFPCSSRHVGQGAERGHPDPERGRPRTGRQEDGGELRTQRRGTYRQTGPAV